MLPEERLPPPLLRILPEERLLPPLLRILPEERLLPELRYVPEDLVEPRYPLLEAPELLE
jgi:hypothetical protein